LAYRRREEIQEVGRENNNFMIYVRVISILMNNNNIVDDFVVSKQFILQKYQSQYSRNIRIPWKLS